MPSCLLCSGRYQAPTMRRRSSFVLNEYRVESSCRRSRPPAQERGRRRRPSNERERLCVVRTARRATPPCLFFAHLTRVPLKAWVRDPARVFYPGSRGSRGPRRLFSPTPDTSAATPSLWRSYGATLHTTVRSVCLIRSHGRFNYVARRVGVRKTYTRKPPVVTAACCWASSSAICPSRTASVYEIASSPAESFILWQSPWPPSL